MVPAEPMTSRFDVDAYAAAAAARGLAPAPIEFPAACPSTNDALAAALEADPAGWPDFSVYGTDHQTSGRGRLGRTWTVPPGAALTFSVPVEIPAGAAPTDLGWIPLAAGLAVSRALRAAGVEALVKWPNDVLAGPREKKICGILVRVVEAAGRRFAVIGMGVNVSLAEADLPVERATSVALEGGATGREDLAAAIVAELAAVLGELFGPAAGGRRAGASAAAQRIRDAIATVGRQVRVELPDGTVLTGRATGLDDGGDLIVAGADGERRISAGDVVHASLA